MFVKFKHTFCGLWHFCLKNNQQTCEKQILGLKFCAEFKRNNGLRLERGWEDIGVLWIIIIFFSFESGEMTVSKIEDWQTWSLWRKCSSQGRNKINCDCLLKKKKEVGGRELVREWAVGGLSDELDFFSWNTYALLNVVSIIEVYS